MNSHFSELNHDPIEYTVEYKRVIAEVNQEVDRFMQEHHKKVFLGACHIAWAAKKRILKNKHNIDWKTPKEMNPRVFLIDLKKRSSERGENYAKWIT
ncbi:MAG: hypothetical protein APF81_12780 [Desulfosporosinus sp. BRH_c37]|nr:MAG: hypothetical protein APF81_12780 [Desulfosporosinus sp. BRH_c37]